MRQLKFPSYEYIKSLPKHKDGDKDFYYEYDWKLFVDRIGNEGVISYNLTGDGWIYFDVFEGGYSDMNPLGMALKFNKANYAKICKHAQKVFEDFYKALDVDWSDTWEEYLEDKTYENN